MALPRTFLTSHPGPSGGAALNFWQRTIRLQKPARISDEGDFETQTAVAGLRSCVVGTPETMLDPDEILGKVPGKMPDRLADRLILRAHDVPSHISPCGKYAPLIKLSANVRQPGKPFMGGIYGGVLGSGCASFGWRTSLEVSSRCAKRDLPCRAKSLADSE